MADEFLIQRDFRQGIVCVGICVFGVYDCILACHLQHSYQKNSQSSFIWIISVLCVANQTQKGSERLRFSLFNALLSVITVLHVVDMQKTQKQAHPDVAIFDPKLR